MKLKKILKESNAPGYKDRKYGEPLPTLDSVKKAYEAKQGKESVNEGEFQASGLDRRALSLFNTKDKSDLKNILRAMVYEMAADGYDEDDVLNLFEKLIYAEVKMLFKKAVG